MQANDIEDLIQTLFESQHFKIRLQDEIKQVKPQSQGSAVYNQIQGVVEEISETLNSLIQFKVTQALNEEYSGFVKGSLNNKAEIDGLKEEVRTLRLSIEAVGSEVEGERGQGRFDRMLDSSSISDKIKPDLKADQGQLTRMRQQINQLKTTVHKLSSHTVLQFVSEANLQMQQKMEENFAKLTSDIQELSTRNSEIDLNASTFSTLNCQEDFGDRFSDINDKILKVKSDIEEKLEKNLRSVWNVITNMENTINSVRRIHAESPEVFDSPTQRTAKKGAGFASLLGWKS